MKGWTITGAVLAFTISSAANAERHVQGTGFVCMGDDSSVKRIAHHSFRIEGGTITLHPSQLGKILSNLKDNGGKLEDVDLKGLSDIQAWMEQARNTYIEGQNIIANLNRFREAAAKAI